MYNELNDLDVALGAKPNCMPAQKKRENVKLKTELIELHKARAARVRVREQWVEKEGGGDTQYFLNLKKLGLMQK